MNVIDIYQDLKSSFGDEPALTLAKALNKIYEEITTKVTREDFSTLHSTLNELAEAQKETQEALKRLSEAQQRTDKKFEELAQTMQSLTLSQQQTDKKFEELALSQQRIDKKFEEFIQFQKRNEKRIDKLESVFGGLAMVVGYELEDKLYPHLEKLAEKVYKIHLKSKTLRKNIVYENGKFDEINIFIQGNLNGETVYLLGECKAQASKKDIEKFLNTLERFQLKYNAKAFPFFVAYSYDPEVEEYLQGEYPDMKYFKTFEIEYEEYERFN